jgi:hypothetical protein
MISTSVDIMIDDWLIDLNCTTVMNEARSTLIFITSTKIGSINCFNPWLAMISARLHFIKFTINVNREYYAIDEPTALRDSGQSR